jgi:cellobiose-specific phosphotransferase system component IIB
VLCFAINAGPSTVLELTRSVIQNAVRDIAIESRSEGQKFYFRHLDRLGVLFVRPHVDYMQSQRNEEVESVFVL